MNYISGEQIRVGDIVRYMRVVGFIEFVVEHQTGDAQNDWFLDEFPGGGAMVRNNEFGHLFLGIDNIDEDLEFVSRGEG